VSLEIPSGNLVYSQASKKNNGPIKNQDQPNDLMIKNQDQSPAKAIKGRPSSCLFVARYKQNN
jgi:hypothetical protein